MIKKNFENILVTLIILISFAVRVYGLSKSPASLGFDEAGLGYNAYSILKTGRDEYGNFLPLSLRSFNDYKPALYAYLSIPFIAVMGPTQTATRMVSVMAGTVSLVFLYFFLREFIKDKKMRYLALFILSFEPWRVHFSRVALETNLSACFFATGAWFLYKKRKVWSVLMLALAAYSYHGARAAAPILLFLFVFDPLRLFFEKNFKRYKDWLFKFNLKYLWMLVAFVIILLPVFLLNKSSQVMTRFRQENVFYRYYPFTPSELVESGKSAWSSLTNNGLYYFLGIMSGHMLSYFSPINLGGRVYKWVKMSVMYIPEFSMIGWTATMLFVFGIVSLIKNIKESKNRFLLYWILAGAAPAALTWTWFHPLRSLNLFPAIDVIIALGLVGLFKFFKNKILRLALLFLFVLLALFTVLNEYNYSVAISHGEYQPGSFKEGVPILAELQDKYDTIIIDSPHAQSYIFFLFYQSFDPKIVQSYADVRPAPGIEGNLNFDFEKFRFEKFDWPNQKNESKILIWTNSEVREDEIRQTPGANVIWLPNAVRQKATAIITKE